MSKFPAIDNARHQSEHGPQSPAGMCLRMVRTAYGAPGGTIDAITAWHNAKHRHFETDPAKIPRGVPVFWSGGSAGHGHVAIKAGRLKCWSTDIRRSGFFDKCDVQDIHDRWGLTLLGWTEDINGVTVPR